MTMFVIYVRLWKSRLLSFVHWPYEFFRAVLTLSKVQFVCTSMSLARSEALMIIFGSRPLFHSRLLPLKGGTVVGWGRKWSGQRATQISQVYGCAVLLIEDGFLRSVGRFDHTISYILDDTGMYYDAHQGSALERMVSLPLSKAENQRTHEILWNWRSMSLSKYNEARDFSGCIDEPYVLVIDQTKGDASIANGLANAKSFQRMLFTALKENPTHKIILKTHPDVVTRRKKGHFDLAALNANNRILVISDPIHPTRLIEQADAVYTVTSQIGFEALIWGKRVRTFGMPFYAGWGLTEDELPSPDRRRSVTLYQLVYAALVKYPLYIDPITMQRCEIERAIAYVGLQRYKRLEFPQKINALGFSRWKRPFIQKFLQGSEVSFDKQFDSGQRVNSGGAIAVWGSAAAPPISDCRKVIRIEDGFLRSSGLGANLVRPLSLVIDDVGIYFDATRPSRLENILSEQTLTEAQVKRAQLLREELIKLDVTKYNLGQTPWVCLESSKRVLLVVGQVETDASIQLGSPVVTSNIELLRRVRAENSQAYIVYKVHPDVTAGLRCRGVQENHAMRYADEVLTLPLSIGSLVKSIDEIHTMTSLMGFEALIRGAKVICHGLPFYAGWGLTIDKIDCPRRTSNLQIDELIYGALISYPRYFNYERNCFIDPECAVAQLAILAQAGPNVRSLRRKLFRSLIVAWIRLKGSQQ